ncbi:MAG TPA: 4,5-DOPA dioxygenase extradiol [Candidatus Limiplasma sp.]|nr:4,5-DOPA dioxygenase extradiol [Candidatus Limiplasma sp.]
MEKQPVLFVGHGSPMNAIEDNPYSRQWRRIGSQLPTPQAILCVSAHWFTAGTQVTDAPALKMIYDMYGFPDALYRVRYSAPGSPRFAGITRELLSAQVDNSWGLDHGSWSVLVHLFPKADIPVFQLSVDRQATPQAHYAMGEKLRELRRQGVLILGSGNVVHNLGMLSWGMDGGYPWADTFDRYIKDSILERQFSRVADYQRAGDAAAYAFRTLDHFAPLLYVLGASDASDRITVFNDARAMGSMSMTGYLFTDDDKESTQNE